jgi:hypothetical protein
VAALTGATSLCRAISFGLQFPPVYGTFGMEEHSVPRHFHHYRCLCFQRYVPGLGLSQRVEVRAAYDGAKESLEPNLRIQELRQAYAACMAIL